jgi:hypothetical protein
VNLRVRLPEGLREQLEAEAIKANRSLNSEILWRIGQTFGEEWRRFIRGMEERERRDYEIMERLGQNPEFQKLVSKLVAEMPRKQGQG